MKVFAWPARVYWEDTDGGGFVYYANYLRFLERARTEWLRSFGHSQRQLLREAGIVFTVVSLEIGYRAPARLDDVLPSPASRAATARRRSSSRSASTGRQATSGKAGGCSPRRACASPA